MYRWLVSPCENIFFFFFHLPPPGSWLIVMSIRGHQELQAVSASIQTLLSTPVCVVAALKGIQKTLGKALPFKVKSPCVETWGGG